MLDDVRQYVVEHRLRVPVDAVQQAVQQALDPVRPVTTGLRSDEQNQQ
ncbi:hypothetical protein OG401_03130 [Kitasatospora purpeofusca]|nr:hypothetical protein [Kitasatospora purpeofusca]MCX4683312.1 hypothetical protein [Kitasatospora purpeofusca]